MRQSRFDQIGRWLVPLFFLAWLGLGLMIFDDYGVTFDDAIQRQHGLISADYLNTYFDWYIGNNEPDYDLMDYEHRYYGTLFSMVGYWLECVFDLETFREFHLVRHLLVFLLFWLASVVFYRMLWRQYRSWAWALLGTVFLIACPRIFAHAFFNVKDLVMLSAYVFCMGSLSRLLDSQKWGWLLWHAFLTGIAINVRIVGIVIPAFTVGWIGLHILAQNKPWESLLRWIPKVAAYLMAAFGFTVLFWPYLWENPVGNLVESFEVMGKYIWAGQVLLFAEYYQAQDIPWFYLPSWMLLTIPLLYWVMFWRGVVPVTVQLIRDLFRWDWNWMHDQPWRYQALHLGFFLMPVLIVLIKQSTLYDGWRQMFFIYPSFAAIALLGLFQWSNAWSQRSNPNWKWALWIAVGLALGQIVWKMVEIHPHQQTYFTELAGDNRLIRFEQDYWGVAYKQGFEAILAKDTSTCITFYVSNYPGTANWQYLPEDQKVLFCPKWNFKDHPKYYLTNYRGETEMKKYRSDAARFWNPFHIIEVDGTPILGVYKLRDD